MTTVRTPTGAPLNTTWKTAPTYTINAGGVEFAYRQLGTGSGVPVVFLTHLAAVLVKNKNCLGSWRVSSPRAVSR